MKNMPCELCKEMGVCGFEPSSGRYLCSACRKGAGTARQAKSIKYAYTFSVWPDEDMRSSFSPALFDLFRLLIPRAEMTFTEEEFKSFRTDLENDGFTLRAVTRVPYHDPEGVL